MSHKNTELYSEKSGEEIENISQNAGEVFHVLKKRGRAIFHELVRNSNLFGFTRKAILYREPDLSPFARPLTDRELSEYARAGAQASRLRSSPFPYPILTLNYYATICVVEMVKFQSAIYNQRFTAVVYFLQISDIYFFGIFLSGNRFDQGFCACYGRNGRNIEL